jgi:ATP-dependent Clp protease ATP-binding subunit ClpA
MRTTLAQAFTIAKNQGRRRIEPRHVLAALLERDQPDPAAVLLHTLSIQASTSDTHPPSTEQR